MRIALAMVSIAFSSSAASISGGLTDVTGAYIAGAPVELSSGTTKYHSTTDKHGIYQFQNLPSGEYTLTFTVMGFLPLSVPSIRVSEREQKRIPDVPLEVAHGLCPRPIASSQVLLVPGSVFGRLSGSIAPPASGVDVSLVCRTFTVCGSTKSDSDGRFSFDTLSPGVYGLNFRRDGFYPENATAYEYTVFAGWESVYTPVRLQQCPNGECDPKLRAPRPVSICE